MLRGQPMTQNSAYQPFRPARRPGGKPEQAPTYRVLVHHQYKAHYDELVARVGIKQAQQFWDHISHIPGEPDPIAPTCIMRGSAGRPRGPGWSKTRHYEISSSARINYQYNDIFKTRHDDLPHKVVGILTIDYSSH